MDCFAMFYTMVVARRLAINCRLEHMIDADEASARLFRQVLSARLYGHNRDRLFGRVS